MGFRRIRVLIVLALNLSGCLEIKEHVANEPVITGNEQGSESGLSDQLVGTPILEQLPADETPVISEDEASPYIIINNGEPYTSEMSFELRVSNPRAYQYRVSQSGVCEGAWTDLSVVKTLPVVNENAKNTVYVQFRDPDFLPSECHKSAVIHDNTAPNIVFNPVPPPSVEVGQPVTIGFQVIDSGVGVKTVSCRFLGNDVPCTTNSQFTYMMNQTGNKTFEVEAEDSFGHRSVQSLSWNVTSATQNIVQTLDVDDNFKVDILFVIDNSGSMSYEQNNMADRIASFIDQIEFLDWQIGVVTTDPRNRTLGDGRLIELSGLTDQYVLTAANGGGQSQNILGQTLQREETGSPYEQGIKATYRAIERSLDVASPNHQLIRDDAGLAVILISDEDESANGTKNDPTNLLGLINNQWNSQKNFGFHSIITRPDDSVCLEGHGAKYGHRYAQLSTMTGSIVGSVCESDYTSQLTGMGEAVAQMKKTVTLSCAPLVGQGYSIEVSKNGQPYPSAFTVDGYKLIFDDFLLEGHYQFSFQCLQ